MKIDENRFEITRKFKEYEMKIIKMAGYITDYYIDRAIESDDFSEISSFLIDYFSGPAGRHFEVGYLLSKYKEYGLNEKAEDIYFDIEEWYKVVYEIEKPIPIDIERERTVKMSEEEYIQYMIEKRKKEIDE